MACHDTGHSYFKLNLIINQLEHIVDRVMVPLNRVFPSATTFAFMGRPLFGPLSCLWSVPPMREGYGHSLPWAGKQNNLVCLLLLWYLVPVWDRSCHDSGVDAFGRHGATHDLA